jgi:hypothetical protein
MRTGLGKLVVATAIALVPIVASADVDPGCQRAVARGGAKFAKVALKVGQRCALRGGSAACRLEASRTTGDRAVDGAIARASERLAKRVRGACAGSDLSAFGARCRATTPVDVAALVACLRGTHLDRVGGLVAIEFPTVAVRPQKETGCLPTESCQCGCVSSPSGAFLAAADLL